MPKDHGRYEAGGERRQRRWHRGWNRGDLAILLCGVLAFVTFTFGGPLLKQEQPAPRNGAAVAGHPTTAAQPTTAAPGAGTADAMAASGTAPPAAVPAGPVLPPAAEPLRIRYPTAGFDVPVHPLALDSAVEATGTIVPPETKDGYWLTPFGIPGDGSTNTTYVIGHSWDGADAPFNHLSSASVVGDTFELDTATGTMTYRVDSVTTYLKESLRDSPIWDVVPNRLVLVSCFTQDPWGKNVVVTASPAAP